MRKILKWIVQSLICLSIKGKYCADTIWNEKSGKQTKWTGVKDIEVHKHAT